MWCCGVNQEKEILMFVTLSKDVTCTVCTFGLACLLWVCVCSCVCLPVFSPSIYLCVCLCVKYLAVEEQFHDYCSEDNRGAGKADTDTRPPDTDTHAYMYQLCELETFTLLCPSPFFFSIFLTLSFSQSFSHMSPLQVTLNNSQAN